MKGGFTSESLSAYSALVSEKFSSNFSEQGSCYDFTRCVRPDGTAYGSSGKCRKGIESALDPDRGITTGASGGVIGGKLFKSKVQAPLEKKENKRENKHLYTDLVEAIKDSKKLLAHRDKKKVDNLIEQAQNLLEREKQVGATTGGRDNAYAALYQPLAKALWRVSSKTKYRSPEAISLYLEISGHPWYSIDKPAQI